VPDGLKDPGRAGKMPRIVATWLIVLVPCALIQTGLARARDLPAINAAENPPAVETTLFDPNSIGTARPQSFSAPKAAQPVVEWNSFEASSVQTDHEQSLRPPNAVGPPVIEPQRNEADSSFDARSVGTARAQYLPPPVERPVLVQRQYLAVSGGYDADSIGNRTAYADSTFAPFGIYESGARFRLSGVASWYKFVASEEPRILGSGRYLEGAFLAGYGIYGPGYNISWFVGPAFGEIMNEGVVTDRWGAKAALEMSAKPTDLTMAAVSANYSTIANNAQVQAKVGVRIFGDVYFGPEAKFTWQKILPFQINFASSSIATTTPVSSQEHIATTRVGAHISALTIGPAFIALSGGWAHDRQLGSGYYGNVTLWQPF
jgi:Cellulose biosynthesis protein BcsS